MTVLKTEIITKDNKKLNLVFAFNYGSHKEIHNAVHKAVPGGEGSGGG